MAGLINFEQEINKVNQELAELKTSLEQVLSTTKKLDQEFSEGAQDASKLNQRLKGVDKTTDQLTISEKELLRIQRASQKVTVESAKAQIQLTEKRKAARREAEKQLGITKKQIPFTKKLSGAFKSAAFAVVGYTAAIYAVIRAITGIVKLNADFQKSMSSLSAITGLTGDDLQFFAKEAKETSKVTLQSANDIVKAFELVGSIRPELLKNKEALAEVTKQAIILSEATGGKLGLEESAKAVAGTLNQFSLSADDAARAANALAAGSKFGSSTADLVTESFSKFGAVADAANITMEQSVALTEILGEKQLFGAEAGTALRGTILRLQKAGVGYASGIFNINDALDEANDLLDKQTDAVKRDQLAIKLFGDRNIVTGNILVANRQKFEDLTEAVTGTTTALEQQAIQNDNLSANWQKLTNRIKSAFIVTGEGSGFLNEIVKGLLRATQVVSQFGFVFVAAAKVTVLAIKSIIAPTMILIDTFSTLGEAVVAAIKGDFDSLKGIMNTGLDSIKTRVVNLKDSYIDAGQAIRDSYNESFKASKEAEQQTISAIGQTKSFTTEYKKSADEIEKTKKKAVKTDKELERERQNRIKIRAAYTDTMASEEIRKNKEALLKKEIDEETFAMNMLNIQAAFLELKKQNEELTNEEILALDQQLLDAQIAMMKLREESAGETSENIIEKYRDEIAAFQDIGNALFDFNSALNERELANLEEQYQHEIDMAGDNEKKKEQIDEKYAKKRGEIKRKQAVADKLQALFNAGINTAVAITAALPNVFLAALVGVLGAVQVATIAAKPLPKFAKGVQDFEGGMAVVGEQGRELMLTPGGGVQWSPDHATTMLLPTGTDVIPNYESEKITQGGVMPEKYDAMIAELKETRKAILNRPVKETNLTDRGLKRAYKHNNSVTNWVDTYMRS